MFYFPQRIPISRNIRKGTAKYQNFSPPTNIQHCYFHRLKIFSCDLTVRRLFVLQAVMTPIFCHRLWPAFPRIRLKQAILRPLLANGNTWSAGFNRFFQRLSQHPRGQTPRGCSERLVAAKKGPLTRALLLLDFFCRLKLADQTGQVGSPAMQVFGVQTQRSKMKAVKLPAGHINRSLKVGKTNGKQIQSLKTALITQIRMRRTKRNSNKLLESKQRNGNSRTIKRDAIRGMNWWQ